MLNRLLISLGGGSFTAGAVMANAIHPVQNIVLDYGAVGDHSTNNSTAIQNACNAVEAAGGGIIYMPEGRYDFATRIDLPTVPFIMLGAGPSIDLPPDVTGTHLYFTGSGTAMRRMDYATVSEWRDGRLQGFTLTNDGTGTLGIDAKGWQRWVVEQIRINGFSGSGGIGLKLDGGYDATIGCWWNTIQNCDISDNETNIVLTGVNGDGQANGNRIRDCRLAEFTRYGVEVIEGNSIVIDGNDISSTLSHSAAVRLMDHACTVTNNLFDPADVGVVIDGGDNQYIVANKGYGVGTMVDTNAGSGHTTSPNSNI